MCSSDLLVSLRRMSGALRGVRRDAQGHCTIGAMTTLTELERSPDLTAAAPAMSRALRTLSNVRIRNVATLGGHLAHGDPHMDLPPILLTLDARVRAVSRRGERWIDVPRPEGTAGTGPWFSFRFKGLEAACEEAARLVAQFRGSGLPGDYFLEFELNLGPARPVGVDDVRRPGVEHRGAGGGEAHQAHLARHGAASHGHGPLEVGEGDAGLLQHPLAGLRQQIGRAHV